MKELTIKDLIQILPMSTEAQKKLLEEYDTYDKGRQFEITRILWEGFDELYEAIKSIKTDKMTHEVLEGTRSTEGVLADMIEKEVWVEIEKRKEHRPEDEEALSHVRDKLQTLLQEK